MSNQRPAPMDPTILDVMSNWLFTDPVPGATKRPNFRVKVLGNVPRLTVKTNVENDKNNGKIDFQTDLATFAVIIETIKKMADGRDTSDGYNWDYEDDFLAGKKLDRPMIISTLQVGRDRESGRMYISILSSDKSRPRIQFWFGPSKYHNMRHRDGSAVTPKMLSEAFASGFANPMYDLVIQLLMSNFNPEAKNVAKNTFGGQGGSSQNRGYNRGGGNGGYNRSNGGNGGHNGGSSTHTAPSNYDGDIVDFDDF